MATVTAQSSLYWAGDVAGPPTVDKMRHQVCSDGLALFDGAYDVEAMLAVAGRMMNVTPIRTATIAVSPRSLSSARLRDTRTPEGSVAANSWRTPIAPGYLIHPAL